MPISRFELQKSIVAQAHAAQRAGLATEKIRLALTGATRDLFEAVETPLDKATRIHQISKGLIKDLSGRAR
jgi:hypothetical protein